MFDLRYHLASLAAVFIALAVGILLGVAISGKLSAADNRFAHDRIDQLNEELQQANEELSEKARLSPMPWLAFAGMTDEDLGAVYDYLRTVPPVRHEVVKFTREEARPRE